MFQWLIGDITGDLVVLMKEMIRLMKEMMIGGGILLGIIWITILFKTRK